jgi:hypothetical protein
LIGRGENMKQMKILGTIVMLLMLGSSLLFSASLVGSWKIDRARTIEANKKENKMGMKMFALMNIYANHTVEITRVGLKSKLHKNAQGYSMIVAGDRVPVTLLDADHLTLQFEDTVYYTRMSSKVKEQTLLKQSQMRFELEKIYRTKIKEDYAFILLSKDRTMYFLQTNRKNRISVKEIKAGELHGQKKRSGFTFADNNKYMLKNGNPYLLMEEKRIQVLSSKKLGYRGNIYALQK